MPNVLDDSLIQAPEAPAAVKPPQLRSFIDPKTTRTRVYDSVLAAAQNLTDMTNQRHSLRLRDVHYADPEVFPLAQQKQAILTGKSLSRRLRGTWDLIDNATGKPIESKLATVAAVPFLTDRGTIIHNGNEYSMANQQRLLPGAYTRVKNNGEIETHINPAQGTGLAHRYYLDPAKSTFYMRVRQAKIPLMPLLRALGATDKQLYDAWGDKLLGANYQADSPVALKKMHAQFVKETDPDAADIPKSTVRALMGMQLDPDVMTRTLGKPYKNLDLDVLLDITKKLIGVSKGEQEVDDRDALANQKVMGIEDLLSERLTKDSGRLRRQLLFKASMQGSLKPVLPGALTKQIDAALLGSGLGQALEEVNTAEILDKQSRITRLGEGGIPADAVPDEARSVSPSHLGLLDLVRTPESGKAGIDLYIGAHTQKGDDGRLYVPVIDAKTGQTVHRSPQDLADLTVAFPGEMSRDAKRIATLEKGRVRWRTRDQVDAILPHFEKSFSPLANLVPLKSAAKAQRMSMAARMLTQAMPLEEPEAPLVQNGVPDMADRSYEQEYGKHMGAVYSDEGGRVLKVTPDSIVMKTPTGETREIELYNNFPFNRKTAIHNTPLVQAGDFVKPGQLLARSNYTDDQGTTALGKNLHVAYMPYMGKNYEDAIVISQAAAKKLSSVHMYQHGLEFDAKTKTGKANYVSMFPSKYDKKVLQTLDNDGVIQPGRIVQYGDPLILAAGEREVTQSKVHKRGMPAFADNTVTWQHHTPGEVVDVVKGNKGINLSVKTVVPMEVGDKLSGRYGDKGVIADIIPDENMPTDSEGKPFEVLLSDLGITTRSNPSQSVEAALGLIAKRTGKPYKPVDFPDDPDADWIEKYAEAELQKHGLKSTDSVWVPELNRKVPNVQRGYRFFMKLQHMSADKGQARGTAAYTMTDEPAKGGETGSKRVSLLNLSALLGHGSTGVLKDAGSVRGQRNDDYWMAFMQGHTPPKVKVPMVYTKFVNELKAAGINVVPDGEKLHIMAMTDKDIDTLAGDREVEHGDTVRWDKGLEPVHGGLFDPTLTGGHGGRKWTKITLAEPMPNPVMEEPIRRVLGLTEKKFLGVLSGQEEMPGGGTGPQAIHKALDAINLDRELAEARAAIASGKKTARDMAVRKLGYLKSAQRLDIHPRDWMLTKAPVLPPAFRPLALMSGNNLPLVSDANYLYKELLDANSNLKSMSKLSDDVGNERLALYQSFKAVTGLADPVHPKLVEKGVGGILKSLFGSSPKHSTLQRKLISSTTDLVGRAVIVPNPELDIDSVGLPEDRAWALYQNFIVRRLSRRGLPMAEALRHAKDRTPLAKEQLLAEMGERPVFIDRAPVLHKFGIMAFWPRLTKGSTLQINPTLVGGFGADFDGDAMQYHVPVEDDARREAIERMMPSRNLMSPADFKSPMPVLRQEYLGGLHTATGRKSKRAATLFRKLEDAIAAYRAGEININDEVEIADK